LRIKCLACGREFESKAPLHRCPKCMSRRLAYAVSI